MGSVSTVAALAMAFGAPLVYADQAYSIYRKQDATGFSHDVCAVLLIANITRCFFWFGEHFEFALLLQSILMILSQLGLLYLCLRFKPITSASRSISSSGSRVIFQATHDRASIDDDTTNDPVPSRTRYDPPQAHPLRSAADDDDNDDDRDSSISYPNKKPLLSTLGLDRLRIPFLGGGRSRYGMVSSSNEDAISSDTQGTQLPSASHDGADADRASSQRTRTQKTGPAARPLNFWQWEDYNSYLVFLGFFAMLLAILQVALGWLKGYVAALGFFALGLESTLPIPQLIANQKRRSLAGFRASVLVGWIGGDSFKLVYFLLRSSPLQFTICALFQLSIDLLILGQSVLYRSNTVRDEAELVQKEERRRAARGEVEVVDVERAVPVRSGGVGAGWEDAVEIETDLEDEDVRGDLGSGRV